MSRSLRFEQVYPCPIEVVWEAITDPTAISEWLMPNDFKPEVGHEFELTCKPIGTWNGIVKCKVLHVDPPRELAYTWEMGKIATELRFTLEPIETGTRLLLVHSGFQGFFPTILSFMLGKVWKGIIQDYVAAVAGKIQRGEKLTGEQLVYKK
jgi:uncharacterized protein YndB with AHSA1/START domain